MFPSEEEDAEVRSAFETKTPYQQWLENITRWDEELRQSGLRGPEPSSDGISVLHGLAGEPE